MEFNSKEFNKFRKAIEKAVEGVEKEFGVSIDFGNIRYDDSSFTIKTTVANGGKSNAAKIAFEKVCKGYGLAPDDFEKEFKFEKNLSAKIVEIKTRSPKLPIIVEVSDGNHYKLPINRTLLYLGKITKEEYNDREEESCYYLNCGNLNLSPTWHGKEIQINDKTYIVSGISTKKQHNATPVILKEKESGKKIIKSADFVRKECLGS